MHPDVTFKDKPTSQLRVLIADDHVIFRQALCSLLEAAEQIEVVDQAGDGEEALTKIKARPPDIAILDISMPRKSGLDTARILLEEGIQTRLVVLSSLDARKPVTRAFDYGVAAYVHKTCPMEDLVEVLYRVAAGETGIIRPKGMLQSPVMVPPPHEDADSILSRLSPRELQVMKLLAEGMNTKETAHRLGLSPKTVETHRSHLFSKLECRSVVALTHIAIREGIITPEP